MTLIPCYFFVPHSRRISKDFLLHIIAVGVRVFSVVTVIDALKWAYNRTLTTALTWTPALTISHQHAPSGRRLPYDVGPARVFLGEAEKTPWLNHTMCGLGPASRVKSSPVPAHRAGRPFKLVKLEGLHCF